LTEEVEKIDLKLLLYGFVEWDAVVVVGRLGLLSAMSELGGCR
jgi:hypothetical protein